MSYQSPHQTFVFEGFSFNEQTFQATFKYSFDEARFFSEVVEFKKPKGAYNAEALQRALTLSFWLAGTSYYKCFPTKKVVFKQAQPDQWQAEFLQKVYTEGLSQFMFENDLTLEDMAVFEGGNTSTKPVDYEGSGTLVLQSGGKDSLLLAELLKKNGTSFTPWYLSASESHPKVLDQFDHPAEVALRRIDAAALTTAKNDHALNGHVPVTYIVASYALVNAILNAQTTVLLAIGAEGNEAHEFIGELPVNHQWSKTWPAEQLFAEFVKTYISADLKIGSPLRSYSELRIAELFVQHAWGDFGHEFSSCNRANYQQGNDNQTLRWCGECPKCANSYLLFAPFVEPTELQKLFGGQDLFQKPMLLETFKGLLGIDGVMKPFECIGEVDELRLAYHMAQENYGAQNYKLPFEVPISSFDYRAENPSQTDLNIDT
jgi:hypothetical protein